MKKSLKKVLALCLVALSAVTLVSCGGDSTKEVVKVYNWGDYIAEEVNDLFEAETGIKVVYDMFETNEDMYLKIKNSGGSSYDVVIPSDYMIKKMINEGMLAEINFENIPNASGIDGRFLGLGYDPDDVYSVPYVWGTVCICYNKNMVDEPVDSWNILWDDKYEKQIYMMNSERDSIAVALLSLGYSINTKDEAELEEAKAKLLEQKPLLITYTLDDAKDKMLGQSGALAVMWSCDVGIVMNELAEMDEDYL